MTTRHSKGAPKRGHREQVNEFTANDGLRPLVVRPLVQTDRLHDPDDITVDGAAIDAGIQHGGTLESRTESLQVRGGGGRKRLGPRGKHHSGRGLSTPRR